MNAKRLSVLTAVFIILFLFPSLEAVKGQEHDGGGAKISFTTPAPGHPLLELSKLPPAVSDALRKTADHYTLFLATENTIAYGYPFLYEYLFDNLSLSALLLRELKLARYNIYEEGPQNYRWIDSRGIFGRFKLVYKEPGKRIYYGSGFYDGKLMPRIDGKAIMIFLYQPVEDGGSRFMQNRLYSYIEVDNALYSTLAKVLKPLLPMVVKGKMNSLVTASRTLSEWIAKDPQDIYRRLEASGRVPRDDLLEFKKYFIDGGNR